MIEIPKSDLNSLAHLNHWNGYSPDDNIILNNLDNGFTNTDWPHLSISFIIISNNKLDSLYESNPKEYWKLLDQLKSKDNSFSEDASHVPENEW
jgi:hypothetical protein